MNTNKFHGKIHSWMEVNKVQKARKNFSDCFTGQKSEPVSQLQKKIYMHVFCSFFPT